MDLAEYLKCLSYKKSPFRFSKTNHLLIKASVNGVFGDFIVDTGASTTCINTGDIDFFNLEVIPHPHKASGAGGGDLDTLISKNNTLKIGRWKKEAFDLITIDLSHVNSALISQKAKKINGIIGSDILKKGKAIIDYQSNTLYIK